MIIEYSKIDSERIKVMRITNILGINIDSFGYAFSSVNLAIGEIISQKEFNNKINIIRKCEKIVFKGEKGEIKVIKYRSDNV